MTMDREITLRYAAMKRDSYADGPGCRTVLWTQGCLLRCPGCQNPHLWDTTGGTEAFPDDLARTLVDLSDEQDITISGGEPLLQTSAVAQLVANIRHLDAYAGHRRNIILYTGMTWEQVWMKARHVVGDLMTLLHQIDVLVEGPYIADLDNEFMQYRGSSNQRVVDVPASLKAGDLVLLDWDTPMFTIDENGAIIGAAGWLAELGLSGEEIPRCGQEVSNHG